MLNAKRILTGLTSIFVNSLHFIFLLKCGLSASLSLFDVLGFLVVQVQIVPLRVVKTAGEKLHRTAKPVS